MGPGVAQASATKPTMSFLFMAGFPERRSDRPRMGAVTLRNSYTLVSEGDCRFAQRGMSVAVKRRGVRMSAVGAPAPVLPSLRTPSGTQPIPRDWGCVGVMPVLRLRSAAETMTEGARLRTGPSRRFVPVPHAPCKRGLAARSGSRRTMSEPC